MKREGNKCLFQILKCFEGKERERKQREERRCLGDEELRIFIHQLFYYLFSCQK